MITNSNKLEYTTKFSLLIDSIFPTNCNDSVCVYLKLISLYSFVSGNANFTYYKTSFLLVMRELFSSSSIWLSWMFNCKTLLRLWFFRRIHHLIDCCPLIKFILITFRFLIKLVDGSVGVLSTTLGRMRIVLWPCQTY